MDRLQQDKLCLLLRQLLASNPLAPFIEIKEKNDGIVVIKPNDILIKLIKECLIGKEPNNLKEMTLKEIFTLLEDFMKLNANNEEFAKLLNAPIDLTSFSEGERNDIEALLYNAYRFNKDAFADKQSSDVIAMVFGSSLPNVCKRFYYFLIQLAVLKKSGIEPNIQVVGLLGSDRKLTKEENELLAKISPDLQIYDNEFDAMKAIFMHRELVELTLGQDCIDPREKKTGNSDLTLQYLMREANVTIKDCLEIYDSLSKKLCAVKTCRESQKDNAPTTKDTVIEFFKELKRLDEESKATPKDFIALIATSQPFALDQTLKTLLALSSCGTLPKDIIAIAPEIKNIPKALLLSNLAKIVGNMLTLLGTAGMQCA
ncbi:MAG: hypothetical protein ACOX3T_01650 [Bdellovibrionota bacterium]